MLRFPASRTGTFDHLAAGSANQNALTPSIHILRAGHPRRRGGPKLAHTAVDLSPGKSLRSTQP